MVLEPLLCRGGGRGSLSSFVQFVMQRCLSCSKNNAVVKIWQEFCRLDQCGRVLND